MCIWLDKNIVTLSIYSSHSYLVTDSCYAKEQLFVSFQKQKQKNNKQEKQLFFFLPFGETC